jgi:hypothetical protein
MTSTLSLLRQLRDRRGVLADARTDLDGQALDAVVDAMEPLIAETVDALFEGGEVEEPVRCSNAKFIWTPIGSVVAHQRSGRPIPFEYPCGRRVTDDIRVAHRPDPRSIASIRSTDWLAWGGDEWPRRRGVGPTVAPHGLAPLASFLPQPATVRALASLDVRPGMPVAINADGLVVPAGSPGLTPIGMATRTDVQGWSADDDLRMAVEVRLDGPPGLAARALEVDTGGTPIGRAPDLAAMPELRARMEAIVRGQANQPVLLDADFELDADGDLVACPPRPTPDEVRLRMDEIRTDSQRYPWTLRAHVERERGLRIDEVTRIACSQLEARLEHAERTRQGGRWPISPVVLP